VSLPRLILYSIKLLFSSYNLDIEMHKRGVFSGHIHLMGPGRLSMLKLADDVLIVEWSRHKLSN
jgi:hypothetical protein